MRVETNLEKAFARKLKNLRARYRRTNKVHFEDSTCCRHMQDDMYKNYSLIQLINYTNSLLTECVDEQISSAWHGRNKIM